MQSGWRKELIFNSILITQRSNLWAQTGLGMPPAWFLPAAAGTWDSFQVLTGGDRGGARTDTSAEVEICELKKFTHYPSFHCLSEFFNKATRFIPRKWTMKGSPGHARSFATQAWGDGNLSSSLFPICKANINWTPTLCQVSHGSWGPNREGLCPHRVDILGGGSTDSKPKSK